MLKYEFKNVSNCKEIAKNRKLNLKKNRRSVENPMQDHGVISPEDKKEPSTKNTTGAKIRDDPF